MPLQIFHPTLRQVAYSVQPKPVRYGHQLGGGQEYRGLVPPSGVPVHLLFRLNLRDPAIGFHLPSSNWLPLLCALRYGACDLGYQVISDSEVRILYLDANEPVPDFPTAHYPAYLDPLPIELATDGYNPDDPRSAWGFSAIYGTAQLSETQKQQVIALIQETGEFEQYRQSPEQSPLEFLAGNSGGPFFEFQPQNPCPNPECANASQDNSLRTFAIYMAGGAFREQLWGPNREDIQIIYLICPLCHAIQVSRQSS